MAINFDDVNGEAKKNNIDFFKFENGENKFRMIGGILPRYVYWKKNGEKNLSIECLSFDRDQEKFTNIEKDWFNHYFPDDKCSWSYMVQVIDPEDGKLKVLGLKKKLFQQILELGRKHLGDPCSVDKGWDVVVDRKKTGPLAFNIEYTLDQMACKNRPLTSEEKEVIVDMKDIDELFPRPTPADQKAFIERVWFKDAEEVDDSVTEEFDKKESETETDFDDDIPY